LTEVGSGHSGGSLVNAPPRTLEEVALATHGGGKQGDGDLCLILGGLGIVSAADTALFVLAQAGADPVRGPGAGRSGEGVPFLLWADLRESNAGSAHELVEQLAAELSRSEGGGEAPDAQALRALLSVAECRVVLDGLDAWLAPKEHEKRRRDALREFLRWFRVGVLAFAPDRSDAAARLAEQQNPADWIRTFSIPREVRRLELVAEVRDPFTATPRVIVSAFPAHTRHPRPAEDGRQFKLERRLEVTCEWAVNPRTGLFPLKPTIRAHVAETSGIEGRPDYVQVHPFSRQQRHISEGHFTRRDADTPWEVRLVFEKVDDTGIPPGAAATPADEASPGMDTLGEVTLRVCPELMPDDFHFLDVWTLHAVLYAVDEAGLTTPAGPGLFGRSGAGRLGHRGRAAPGPRESFRRRPLGSARQHRLPHRLPPRPLLARDDPQEPSGRECGGFIGESAVLHWTGRLGREWPGGRWTRATSRTISSSPSPSGDPAVDPDVHPDRGETP
jgi:hypothetical protein